MRNARIRVCLLYTSFAVAFALFLAVVLVGIALSDNPVKKFFKQQEVLDIAKMHMSQVKKMCIRDSYCS